MKKIIISFLAIGMSLAMLTACGKNNIGNNELNENNTDNGGTEKILYISNFVGQWNDSTSERAYMTIVPSDNDSSEIIIHWGSSYNEATEWNMHAVMNEENEKLKYSNGEKANIIYSDDGSIESKDVKWNDAEGTLSFDKNGNLKWTDNREETSGEFNFVKYTLESPTADAFINEYFHVIGGYKEGTSGSSLAKAKAAYNALKFANDYQIWIVDIESMRDTMFNAWESMNDSEREAFDANFMDVLYLINACIENYDENAYIFEDAGVDAEMKNMVNNSIAQQSWDTLSAHTLTMGNS